MTIQLKMPFNQSSNYGLMTKDMEERIKVEKILEMERILEISQRKIKMSILHAAYARRQITPRNIVDGAGKSNVDTVKNLDMRRKIVTAKISIKQILLKSTSVRMINMTMSNIFSMLHKTAMMN
jgi:hypothetical protein